MLVNCAAPGRRKICIRGNLLLALLSGERAAYRGLGFGFGLGDTLGNDWVTSFCGKVFCGSGDECMG